MRRVLNKGEVIVYEFLVPKKEILGWESGATDELWYSADFLSGCWCFSWFPWPVCPPGFLCFFVDVAPNPRIQCTGICEFSTATACVFSHVFFLCILSSSQDRDALHTVLNSLHMHTLPKNKRSTAQQILFRGVMTPCTLACKARPSFDRCGTSLSVSLSL